MTDKPQEAGYRIRGTFYPVPTSRRLADAALIEQLTGLTVQEYVRRARAQIDEAEEAKRRFEEAREHGELPENAEMEMPEFDELVSLAGIGIAVSRVHPGWSRTRVHDFVASLENDEIEFVGGDTDDEEDAGESDDGPPAPTETDSKRGSTSPPPLKSDTEARSNGSETPQTSGQSTSPMSPVER
jgi:hypothetical protein